MVGRHPVQSSGVCGCVPGADVLTDWHRWLRHSRHFHRRMLCHCQPQPNMPYAGSYSVTLLDSVILVMVLLMAVLQITLKLRRHASDNLSLLFTSCDPVE